MAVSTIDEAGSGRADVGIEDRQAADLQKVRRLAWWLDAAVPLPGGFRIGLDGLIGLIPGVGDAAGAAASSYILVQARKMGVPPIVMARMVGNVLLEMIIGVIPLIGDLFDITFRANLRNVDLMQRSITHGKTTKKTSGLVVVLGVIAVVFGFAVSLFLMFKLLNWSWQLLFGG